MRLFEFDKTEIKISTMSKTLYVSRKLVNVDEFKEWAIAQGFKKDLLVEDMHVTICISKRKVDWQQITPLKNSFVNKKSKRAVKQFSPTVNVMTFESNLLQERWHEFINIGATADFIPYVPHISISYEQENVDISIMDVFSKPLIFGPEIFSEIKS